MKFEIEVDDQLVESVDNFIRSFHRNPDGLPSIEDRIKIYVKDYFNNIQFEHDHRPELLSDIDSRLKAIEKNIEDMGWYIGKTLDEISNKIEDLI